MPHIKFSVSEEAYVKLTNEAKKRGITLQDYIRSKVFDDESIFTPAEAVNRAKNKFSNDDVFSLPDIYGNEWNVQRGAAGVIGRNFYNFVEEHPEHGITYVGIRNRRAVYKIKK